MHVINDNIAMNNLISPFPILIIQTYSAMGQNTFKTKYTPCGTRTRNLRIRSPTPCPLGQGGRYYSMEFRRHSTFQHFTFIFIAPLKQKHSLIHARARACIMKEQSINACIAFAGPSFIRNYSSQRITQIQSPHS